MKRIIAALAILAASLGLVGAMSTPASALTVCVHVGINGTDVVNTCVP